MIQSAAILTVPLIVAFHCVKKPFIHGGFDNLNTDGNGGNGVGVGGIKMHFLRFELVGTGLNRLKKAGRKAGVLTTDGHG